MPTGVFVRTDKMRNKMRVIMKGKNTAPKSEDTKRKIAQGHYKGGSDIYFHKLAWKLFGKDHCEKCNISLEAYTSNHKRGKFDMHTLSHNFRILEFWNWICLCRKCHVLLERASGNDYGRAKAKQTRNKNKIRKGNIG